MKKYLDILIFTLLFFLLFSYFSGNKGSELPTGFNFSVNEESYKVPAGVKLSFANYTGTGETLLPCEDLSLRFEGKKVDFPTELCSEVSLPNGQETVLDLSSHYSLFENPGVYSFDYERGEEKFTKQIDVSYRGTIGKTFVGLFYAPLYNLMIYLIVFFGSSLGLAIITITIIIRILLLFPQHKMMVSQRKMQAIQPKIKDLQKKYKDNQQQLGMELMKLYKKEGVNPMGSCGLLLIQMPILLVIYRIIIDITSVKNEFYLYDFIPEFHVSQIDFNFFGIDLLAAGGITGIFLALSVALIQFIQVKLSFANKPKEENATGVVLEKKKGEDSYNSMMPDPEMMNKVMLYGMPVMVGIFTYTLIAGVGIYWGVSTLFAIFQQLFVNKIIKK